MRDSYRFKVVPLLLFCCPVNSFVFCLVDSVVFPLFGLISRGEDPPTQRSNGSFDGGLHSSLFILRFVNKIMVFVKQLFVRVTEVRTGTPISTFRNPNISFGILLLPMNQQLRNRPLFLSWERPWSVYGRNPDSSGFLPLPTLDS